MNPPVPLSVVAAALGVDDPGAVELVTARVRSVHAGDGQGEGVWVAAGTARLLGGGPDRPFTAVRKRLRRGARDPGAWDAVDREVDAYASGLLAGVVGIEAPRVLGIHDADDGAVDLWLEHVAVAAGAQATWDLRRYARAAHDLGVFGARGLTRTDGDRPWLARRWLRQWVEAAGPEIARLERHADDPLVRIAYPPEVRDVVLKVWAEREAWLAALEALPHGLAHQDAFRRNLADRAGRTVAFDWAFVGPAPVGAETAPLLVATVAFGEWPLERWHELDRAVREGYVAGLRTGGWHGPAELVALGHAAAAVLRYPVGTVRLIMPHVLGETDRSALERVLGVPYLEAFRRWGQVGRIGIRLHEEAARLLAAAPG